MKTKYTLHPITIEAYSTDEIVLSDHCSESPDASLTLSAEQLPSIIAILDRIHSELLPYTDTTGGPNE